MDDMLVTKPLWEDEMLKDLIKNTTDEDIEKFCEMLGLTRKPDPIFVDEKEFLLKEEIEKSVKRKAQLMKMEKEILVDMVFNLESRNETLVNNLLEVEKMYDKLKEEKGKDLAGRVSELETEVFSLRNQNRLWQCIVEGYKKEKMEENKND